MNRFSTVTALLFLAAATASFAQRAKAGQPIVPGTGEFLKDCSDDFEDPNECAKVASASGLPVDQFRLEFEYLIEDEPPPIHMEDDAFVTE